MINGNKVSVRLNNQDGTPVAMVYPMIHEISGASLLKYKGDFYSFSHLVSDCLIYQLCGKPLDVTGL